MAASTLNVSFSDLKSVTGRELGFTGTSGNWDAEQAADVAAVVNTALRRIYTAHDWNWLRIPTTLSLWGSITGTMTVSGGSNTTVTADSSVFYPTVVGQTIVSTNGSYTISAYTSGTVVTVSTNASADTGEDFTITATGNYRLPDDFGGIDGEMFFASGTSYAPVKIMGQADILRMRSQCDETGIPRCAAVRWTNSDSSTFQACELMVFPLPDQVYTMNWRYRKLPDALVATTNEYPFGHLSFSELFRTGCLAAAEEFKGVPGVHSARYQQLLAEAIARDGRMAAQTLGSPAFPYYDEYFERGGRVRYNGALP